MYIKWYLFFSDVTICHKGSGLLSIPECPLLKDVMVIWNTELPTSLHCTAIYGFSEIDTFYALQSLRDESELPWMKNTSPGFIIDVFYKLVKSELGAQYDPKIGMFRSDCLKVYGMSISYQIWLSKSLWDVSISLEYIVLWDVKTSHVLQWSKIQSYRPVRCEIFFPIERSKFFSAPL